MIVYLMTFIMTINGIIALFNNEPERSAIYLSCSVIVFAIKELGDKK